MSKKDIEHRFTYHPPHPDTVWMFSNIREAAKAQALWLDRHLPDSREKSLALTALEEAVFWANAAVARTETVYEGGYLKAPVKRRGVEEPINSIADFLNEEDRF